MSPCHYQWRRNPTSKLSEKLLPKPRKSRLVSAVCLASMSVRELLLTDTKPYGVHGLLSQAAARSTSLGNSRHSFRVENTLTLYIETPDTERFLNSQTEKMIMIQNMTSQSVQRSSRLVNTEDLLTLVSFLSEHMLPAMCGVLLMLILMTR